VGAVYDPPAHWTIPHFELLQLLLSSVLVLLISTSSLAQSTGTLWGSVSDPNGNVIPEVTVTLRNRNIGYAHTTQTDRNGLYQIGGLAVGIYEIEVRARWVPGSRR
jgi:hypothetical protein